MGRLGRGSRSAHARRGGGAGAGLRATSGAAAAAAAEFGLLPGRRVRGRPALEDQHLEWVTVRDLVTKRRRCCCRARARGPAGPRTAGQQGAGAAGRGAPGRWARLGVGATRRRQAGGRRDAPGGAGRGAARISVPGEPDGDGARGCHGNRTA